MMNFFFPQDYIWHQSPVVPDDPSDHPGVPRREVLVLCGKCGDLYRAYVPDTQGNRPIPTADIRTSSIVCPHCTAPIRLARSVYGHSGGCFNATWINDVTLGAMPIRVAPGNPDGNDTGHPEPAERATIIAVDIDILCSCSTQFGCYSEEDVICCPNCGQAYRADIRINYADDIAQGRIGQSSQEGDKS